MNHSFSWYSHVQKKRRGLVKFPSKCHWLKKNANQERARPWLVDL